MCRSTTARYTRSAGGSAARSKTATEDEHARFVAHLLDPNEYDLIEKSFSTATVFRDLGDGGAVAALADEPGTVVDSLVQNPELDAVISAAQTILDFKTQAVRDIEAPAGSKASLSHGWPITSDVKLSSSSTN